MFGGQVGLSGHLNVANGVKIAAQSGVNSSLNQENATFMGTPAMDYSSFIKSFVLFRNFPKLVNQISALEKELKELKEKIK